MTDPRRMPVNARVAAADWPDIPEGVRPVKGMARQVALPVVDLLRTPGGPRDRQLLLGEQVTVLETHQGWSFVRAEKDGYVGYLFDTALAKPAETTHVVSVRASHLHSAADFKSQEGFALSFGSRIRALSVTDKWVETSDGFVPRVHLRESGHRFEDPLVVASLFRGTPYLWGGNSTFGVDCSGLVQAALLACGIPCPGDSDMQAEEVGEALPAGMPFQRGDLLFWKGHVALVENPDVLLHANAHHMAVAREPLPQAIERIAAQGDGPVTAHRRVEKELK